MKKGVDPGSDLLSPIYSSGDTGGDKETLNTQGKVEGPKKGVDCANPLGLKGLERDGEN